MPNKDNQSVISGPLRSEMIKALITQKASFIERNASLLFIFILMLVFVLFSLIRYPTILNTRGNLSTFKNDSISNNRASTQSINCVVSCHISRNDSKCIKAGTEIKLRIKGTLPQQFVIVECYLDSSSKGALSGKCLLFSTISMKEINKIKLVANPTDIVEADIFVAIDNPTILQRLLKNFFKN